MRDNSRNDKLEGWAREHNEVVVKIHTLLEDDFPDAISQWELRIQNRTDESHVRYIQTIHDRLAAILSTLAEDTKKA